MAVGRKTGGRQKGSLNKATAEVIALAREYGPEAIEKLAYLMREGENQQTQRAACSELLDRAYGRPTQQTDINGGLNVITRAVYHDPTKRAPIKDN